MKADLVIFDLDGTLLDTSEGIINSVKYVINKNGFDCPEISEMRSFIGPPVQSSFARVYNLSSKDAVNMGNAFRNHYKNNNLYSARPYDGIYDTLNLLHNKGIKLAIATYKRQDYAELIIEYFKMNRYFDCICGSDFEGKLTKKDIISNAIKSTRISSKNIYVIGDTLGDYQGAHQNGLKFLGVTYGFGFKSGEELNDSDVIGMAYTSKDIIGYFCD